MNTDDEMGTCFDTNSLCSDISLHLDESFFRRDSLSLAGKGNASNPFNPMAEYQVYNQVPFINYSQQQLPFVEEEEKEKEKEDSAIAKSTRGNGKGPFAPRKLRTNSRKASSFDPVRVSREHRHVIQHNYCDHAFDPDEAEIYNGRGGNKKNAASVPVAKKKGGVAVPFPLKLHELLEKAEEENLTHIVSWSSHGRAFVVHDPKMFIRHLMPRFFRQTKLTSFQRQLNLYGFCRLTRGRDSGGYYHELFLRGKTHLTKRMARTKIKGTGYKAATNPSCEPDFYKMPPVGPTSSNRYPSINTDTDVVCDSVSDYNENEDDDDSVNHTFPHLPNIPIVTPTNSFHTTPDMSARSDRAMILTNDGSVAYGPNRSDGEVWPCFECTPPMFTSICSSSRQDVSPLKPRHKSPIVRMGNQSFQYIESLHFNSNNFRTDGRPREDDSICFSQSNRPGLSMPSFSHCDSSTIGDISLSVIDENSIQYDPLDVFLEEMGDTYEEGINAFPATVVVGGFKRKADGP